MSDNTLKNQNNPFNATDLLTYANLQIAAEALYGLLGKEAGLIIDDGCSSALVGKGFINSLTDGNDHTSKFTTTQAEQFVQNWKVVQHIANTASGFSGTLFENIHTGELVLSFRSTEFIEDYIRDNIATNTYEIFKTGWAWGQIADMEEWFSSLKTAGLIPDNQQITVTGYSLGGHLATAFHILHQNENLIKNTLTFNGAGVGSMGGDDITTDKELRNAINNFSNCHKNGVGHLLTGKVTSSQYSLSVADFYNKIRTSLKEVLDSIGNNTDISQYIVELEKLYSYC